MRLAPVVPRPSRAAEGAAAPAADEVAYQGWDDVYRKSWQWDKVVHSSHARANPQSAIEWTYNRGNRQSSIQNRQSPIDLFFADGNERGLSATIRVLLARLFDFDVCGVNCRRDN